MPVPADILAVSRPKNTVVYVYGKNKDRYGVKERVGCVRKNGKNYPVNGRTVGHIIHHQFVPVPDQEDERAASVACSKIDLITWGGEQLLINLGSSVLEELLQVYNSADSLKIFSIAVLRVLNPGIPDRQLKAVFDESFLSVAYPSVALSRNTVCDFTNNLGKTCSRIRQFMKNRASSIKADDSVLIDGTLKTNDSKINSLSEFSRKAKMKGRRDISVLYAFDLSRMEPVCSEVFPGNMLDLRAYEAFVKENGIKSGVLVGDKGFPSSSIEEVLKENSELHYLNPLRRSSKVAANHDMYNYTGVLSGEQGIQYKKEKVNGKNKWLYSFRSPVQASLEEVDWIRKSRKDETYTDEEYRQKREKFGTIVLESDLSLDPEKVYRMYSQRWEIEIVMSYYKTALSFGETRVQDDYSVIGSEFIDFISTILTFKLLKKFDQLELLKDFTYKDLMRILNHARKVRVDENWELIRTNKNQLEILEKLELIQSQAEPPKKKRGRPRKKPAV